MGLASEKMKFLIHTDVLLLGFVSVFQKMDADRDLSNLAVQDRWAFWAECISKNMIDMTLRIYPLIHLDC